MAEGDKLLPTIEALKQHILRVHIQTQVLGQAAITQQDPQLDPLENGYFKDSDGQLKPTTPVADGSSTRCSCRTKNLPCTVLSVWQPELLGLSRYHVRK